MKSWVLVMVTGTSFHVFYRQVMDRAHEVEPLFRSPNYLGKDRGGSARVWASMVEKLRAAWGKISALGVPSASSGQAFRLRAIKPSIMR